MNEVRIDTPAKHNFIADGSTRVFQIPTRIIGDDYVRIEINGEVFNDRTAWDTINNSIVFVTAPLNGDNVSIQVATSDEAVSQLGSTSNTDIVATNIGSVNNVAGSIDNVNIVRESIENVNTVATNVIDVNTVATNVTDVNTVATNVTDVNTVATNIDSVNTVATNITDILSVVDSAEIVATNIESVNTVTDNITKVNAVGTYIEDVKTVSNNIGDISTVVDNMEDVNTLVNTIPFFTGNIETFNQVVAEPLKTSILNAGTNATKAQISEWEAEADKRTTDSYATEAEDVFVKIWKSNGDGTFSYDNSTDYSALHYSKKAEAGVSVDWGNIEGNITAQTDLNTALNGKLDNSGEVFLDGILKGGVGAIATNAGYDWNDPDMTRSGSGKWLLNNSSPNAPMNTVNYFYSFCFEYGTKDGTGNLTQLAIPYRAASDNTTIFIRNRYSGVWSEWTPINGVGSGQKYVNYGTTKKFNTNYVNTTGQPIQLYIYATNHASGIRALVDNVEVFFDVHRDVTYRVAGSVVIPAGATYKIVYSGTLAAWTELR